jgi:hypothetical protein
MDNNVILNHLYAFLLNFYNNKIFLFLCFKTHKKLILFKIILLLIRVKNKILLIMKIYNNLILMNY